MNNSMKHVFDNLKIPAKFDYRERYNTFCRFHDINDVHMHRWMMARENFMFFLAEIFHYRLSEDDEVREVNIKIEHIQAGWCIQNNIDYVMHRLPTKDAIILEVARSCWYTLRNGGLTHFGAMLNSKVDRDYFLKVHRLAFNLTMAWNNNGRGKSKEFLEYYRHQKPFAACTQPNQDMARNVGRGMTFPSLGWIDWDKSAERNGMLTHCGIYPAQLAAINMAKEKGWMHLNAYYVSDINHGYVRSVSNKLNVEFNPDIYDFNEAELKFLSDKAILIMP
jgi:hypothetical protein